MTFLPPLLQPLQPGERRIPKSRYDSVDSYISSSPLNRPEYNDNVVPIDEAVKQRLLDSGIDEPLAHHVAHLYIRDPLVIFKETLDQDDHSSTDHFENIQSTNWQTLRFKPPPPNTDIGWRVEFRSMEVQPTDFENAAYSVFIVLLTRAILSFGLNFYMPVSKVRSRVAASCPVSHSIADLNLAFVLPAGRREHGPGSKTGCRIPAEVLLPQGRLPTLQSSIRSLVRPFVANHVHSQRPRPRPIPADDQRRTDDPALLARVWPCRGRV